MLGLRFMGIRARLLLLFVVAGLAGAFSLVPLLPSDQLALAYPRIALVMGVGAFLAAWIGRAMVRPLEDLQDTVRQRLAGKEVQPARDHGLDEVHDLAEVLTRFFVDLDQKAARAARAGAPSSVETDRDTRALLGLAQSMAGGDGAAGAIGRLLDGVRDHLRLGHLSLLLRDGPSGKLELHAAAGLSPELLAELETHGPRPVKFAAGVGVAGQALATGRTKVAPRGHRDREFARLGGDFERDVRSLACVPLRAGGDLVGVLNAVNISRDGGFSLPVIEFLEEVGRLLEGWLPGYLGGEHSEELDPLTGVLCQEAFAARLEEEIARHRRFPRALSVAVLELDFPGGRPEGGVGGAALLEVGRILKHAVRGLDRVGRDGERFYLCLPETELLGAIHLAGRVKDMVDRAAVCEFGRAPRFVAQLGLASAPEVVEDPAELVRAAEGALVESMRAGDHRLACARRKVA